MPLISVVIPTRNRNTYLIDSINVALNSIHDVEIVICDNSDTDVLRSMLGDLLQDGRVKYMYSSEKLSVVDNFERAFLGASGDYIISIGDDDAIGPGLEQIALWAKENKVDAVVSYCDSFIASYYWPGVRSKYFGDSYASHLFVNDFSGRVVDINPIDSLKRVANRLGGGLGSMPRAYHGLVSRTLIEEIRERHGGLFGGVSPDIYSAALIAGFCQRAVVIDFPFVIPGASPVSTAGQGAERSDRGGIKSTEHTARFGDKLVWDRRIPEFYSPHTVWAYSLCKALELIPHLGVKPNFCRLYASCFLYSRQHRVELYRAMKNLAESEGGFKVSLKFSVGIAVEGVSLFGRIFSRMSSPKAGGKALRYGPFESISSAFVFLNKFISDSGKKILFKCDS